MIKRFSFYFGVLCAIIGTAFALDNRWFHTSEALILKDAIAAVDKKTDSIKDTIRAEKVQERIWKLEEWYDKKPMPSPVKEQYKDLQNELQELNKRIKK